MHKNVSLNNHLKHFLNRLVLVEVNFGCCQNYIGTLCQSTRSTIILVNDERIEISIPINKIASISCLAYPVMTYLLVPQDYSTIQEAIDAAENGDTVLVSEGTYQENINFNGKAIIVRSTDPANETIVANTIIDGQSNGSPVVTFENGESDEAVLTGFTIQNGLTNEGGGIYIANNSNPTIKTNIIYNNMSYYGGGGIHITNSNPVIDNNDILSNTSNSYGGGIFTYYSNPIIKNNNILNNYVGLDGGGIELEFGTPIVNNNTINNNVAGRGGGIDIWYSDASISENVISSNDANYGGGIYLENAASEIMYNDITENIGYISGGGIYLNNSTTTITNNTITENEADLASHGGGIYVDGTSTPFIDSNTISGNTPDDVYYEL